MCGITGYWSAKAPESGLVNGMARRLMRRGPDDCGSWLDTDAGLALGHRRLSILDLSESGHQPMVSPCGRYVIVYNGEIYNHADLRRELEVECGHFAWRGHSDTETLLAALRHWGVEAALQRLNGMFAFALWDSEARELFLARDRTGEKPLYYGRSGDAFLFGSELKALAAHPDWYGAVNREALTQYLRYGYVPAPWSIYRGIAKLPAAHYVVVRENGRAVSEPTCYWNLTAIANRCGSVPEADDRALTDELETLLRDAVGRRMVADVPLGAFLSGGYDSSTVVALMQAQSDKPVQTFSIGFHEGEYNEAAHAKAVAGHLGTDHTELYISPRDAMAVIPELPGIWDEPFADASQIPTYLVSQLARRSVKVSLSGDGGDELFCGYNRYVAGYRLWQRIQSMPVVLRRLLSRLLARLPVQVVARAMQLLPAGLRVAQLEERLPKLASALAQADGGAFYRDLVSGWKDPAAVVLGGREPSPPEGDAGVGRADLQQQMMLWDALGYLPDDILTKTDRATMAVGLEGRIPLLDHRVVEFAWRVPQSLKYRNGQGKWLLRQVLYRYVPPALMDRPKMGFTVPTGQWLRGPLRDWAESLLDERRLEQQGYFDPRPVRRTWEAHLSGKHAHPEQLWTVLMFQAWLEERGIQESDLSAVRETIAAV